MRRDLIFSLLWAHFFLVPLESVTLQEQLDGITILSKQGRLDVSNDKELVSGLNVVGCGYDVTSMVSRFCLLDLGQASEAGSWIDPQNTSREFFVPHGFDVRDAPEATHILETRVIHTVQEYFQQSIYRTTRRRRGFLGFGAKRTTTEVGSLYRRFYEQNYRMALTARQIIWYVLSVVTFPPPKLNAIARNALADVPNTFDATNATNVMKFNKFFESFGTHVVISSAMGGLVWAQDWLETCLLQHRNVSWIKRQVTRRHDPFGAFRSTSNSHDTTILENTFFEEHSSYSLQLLGGTQSIQASNWTNWVPSVRYNPRPVSYDLEPIYTLLPIGNAQRDALEQATNHYLEEANKEASVYIDQLQSMPKPPPSRCVPPASRRRRSIFDLTAENLASLCPYVGTDGLTCHGISARSQAATGRYGLQQAGADGLIRLPRGVGTAFDLSTGRLTFPAFSWTFEGGTRWQEHRSTRIFLIPAEIALQPIYTNAIVEQRDEQIYRKFDKTLAEQNIINGGFFARQSNATEYYEKYDAPRQMPAVVQNPIVSLYHLTALAPKLNSLASAALAQLTTNYDEVLYRSFLDVWGTHIAVNTTIGGMVELWTSQQRCKPIPRPGAECDSISDNREYCKCMLTKYPSLNILNHPGMSRCGRPLIAPPNSLKPLFLNPSLILRSRRQDTASTKRRLGGDVTLDDNAQWEPTIGQNPALLMINRFAPWSDFVTDVTIKLNLNTAISARIQSARTAQANSWATIEQRRAGVPRCPTGEQEAG